MKFQKGSIRRSLYYSILDGLFTAMMLGVSDTYLVPYSIALGATSTQIALLASVPMLVATLLQLQSARVTELIGSRTKLIRFVVFFHALSWAPIILIPFIFSKLGRMVLAPWALIAAVIVYMSFGAFAVPAWQSLMSDYIPVKKRGQYFGWRNRLQGLVTVTISVSAGLVLHFFGKDSLAGFVFIFIFAMGCRFYAWVCLTRMAEPFRHTTHDEYFSFADFLKGLKTSHFARFVVFVSLVSFSANVSGPLLPAFLLRDLGFGYATYMFIIASAALSGFLSLWLWGKYGDLYGNVRVLKVACWGIAVTPLFWMISRHPAYLFFVQLFAGSVWAGFNLLVTNFLMEAVSPERRIRSISYFNVMNSFFVFFGASLGGLVIHRLPKLFGYSYLTLFLISCACRLFVMLVVAERVREVRANV